MKLIKAAYVIARTERSHNQNETHSYAYIIPRFRHFDNVCPKHLIDSHSKYKCFLSSLSIYQSIKVRDMASASSCCHNGDNRSGSSSGLPAPEQRPLGSILPEEIQQVNPNKPPAVHPFSGITY